MDWTGKNPVVYKERTFLIPTVPRTTGNFPKGSAQRIGLHNRSLRGKRLFHRLTVYPAKFDCPFGKVSVAVISGNSGTIGAIVNLQHSRFRRACVWCLCRPAAARQKQKRAGSSRQHPSDKPFFHPHRPFIIIIQGMIKKGNDKPNFTDTIFLCLVCIECAAKKACPIGHAFLSV